MSEKTVKPREEIPSASKHGFVRENNHGGAAYIVLALIFIAIAAYFLYQNQSAPPSEVKPQIQSKSAAQSKKPEAIKLEIQTLPEDAAGRPEVSSAVKAANAGEYAKAAGLLRVAMQQYPDSPEVKNLLVTALNNDAIKEMDSGRYKQAHELLTEAHALSNDAAITRNLAAAQIKLSDYKAAVITLEQIDKDPSTATTLQWLYNEIANKAYRDGRLSEAVKYYEKLAALTPNDTKLSEAIIELKKQSDAEAKMGTREGGHFTVRYEGGENSVAGHVIGLLLEEAYYKVGSDLQFYPDDRIEALLYTKETFRDVTGSPSWAGALFDGRIKVPVGGVTDKTALLEKVLFHEYTHAVIFRLSGGRTPVWLNEGLAQIAEGEDAGPYREGLKAAAIAFRQARSTHNVLRGYEGSFMGLTTQQAQVAYLTSLSATQYLVKEFGAFSARRILENLRAGKNFDDAFFDATSLSYDDFCEAWITSLSHS